MLETFCPIWPTRDIDAAEAFYRKLGFRTAYKDKDTYHYLLMKREDVEVHFFLKREHDPSRSDHGGYMRPSDVDRLSAEIAALGLPSEGIPRFVPAQDKPWGMRELVLVDPDGNLIRAGQDISVG